MINKLFGVLCLIAFGTSIVNADDGHTCFSSITSKTYEDNMYQIKRDLQECRKGDVLHVVASQSTSLVLVSKVCDFDRSINIHGDIGFSCVYHGTVRSVRK